MAEHCGREGESGEVLINGGRAGGGGGGVGVFVDFQAYERMGGKERENQRYCMVR